MPTRARPPFRCRDAGTLSTTGRASSTDCAASRAASSGNPPSTGAICRQTARRRSEGSCPTATSCHTSEPVRTHRTKRRGLVIASAALLLLGYATVRQSENSPHALARAQHAPTERSPTESSSAGSTTTDPPGSPISARPTTAVEPATTTPAPSTIAVTSSAPAETTTTSPAPTTSTPRDAGPRAARAGARSLSPMRNPSRRSVRRTLY